MSNNTTIENLIQNLDQADHLYYMKDNPELTDEEYDNLKKKYKELTGKEWLVLGGVSSMLQSIKHKYAVKSLAKIDTPEELRQELLRLAPAIIQPKYDGLTIVKQKSVYLTRGDGITGENVTATASKVLPMNTLKIKYPIRAEVYMELPTFKKINDIRVSQNLKPYKNTRNTAAGMIRQKDATKIKGLTYTAYDILGASGVLTESEKIRVLESLGYKVPDPKYCFYVTRDNIEEAIEWVLNFPREELPYEIDGLVIKSDVKNSSEIFGETEHHPKNAVAYKFPSQGKWTRLIDVKWQTGRTGVVTPVAIFEPVDILGSTIQRASVHNSNILKILKLSIGCLVYVIKSKDVIPVIVQSKDYDENNLIGLIDTCPECGHPLSQDKTCPNDNCPGKVTNRIVHLAKREALDIEGLSIETADNLVELGLIKSPYDIFKLTAQDLMKIDHYAEISANKLYEAIQNSRKVSLDRFLLAGGVLGIGKKIARNIAEHFTSYDALMHDINTGCNELFYNIPGIGEELTSNIIKHVNMWIELREFVTPTDVHKVKKAENQLTFVITGTFDQPRKYYEKLITEAGHKVTKSVSKKTSYLVVGQDPGSKVENAKDKNVPIIDDKKLLELLN